MTCHELAQRLFHLSPSLSQIDVARLTLMILSQTPDPRVLSDDLALMAAWRNATFRLEAAADQHAAVSEELESICSSGTVEFSSEQFWVLLRAVKVQSQILELYTEPMTIV